LKAAEAQNRQLAAQMEKLAAAAPKQSAEEKQKTDGKADLPFKDLNAMSDEEILDWQSENPKEFLTNLKKAVAYELMAEQQQLKEAAQKQEVETKVEQTYSSYAQENPDFDAMWDSGEIREFMEKNPGHNAISAHMAMTAEARQEKAVKAAVAKALKEAETARRSVRKTAAILGQGPTSVPTSPAASTDDLKNPNKFGGHTSVLAARLVERRRAAP
jgi:myosin heavy subunit